MFMKKVRQHDERDCGAACFATILSKYGINLSLQESREAVSTDIQGTNIYNIVKAGKKYGFNAEAYAGDFDSLLCEVKEKNIKLPIIAHIISEEGLEHFVVVCRINRLYVQVFDPAKGSITVSKQKFKSLWTGHIIVIDDIGVVIQKRKSKSDSRAVYKKILKDVWPKYLITMILSLVIVVISLLGTMGYKVVIDGIMPKTSIDNHIEESEEIDSHSDDLDNEPDFGIINKFFDKMDEKIPLDNLLGDYGLVLKLLILLYLISFLLQLIRDVIVSLCSKKIDLFIMNMYSEKLMNLPIRFFSGFTSGELVSRFTDLQEVRDLISGYSLNILFDIMVFLCGAILMWVISPDLLLLVIIVAMLYFVLIVLFGMIISKINTRFLSKNAKTVTDFKELTDNIDKITYCGGKKLIRQKLEQDYKKLAKINLSGNIVSSVQNSISVILESVSVILTLYIGSKLVISGVMTMGFLVTFSMLISYMLIPIRDLVSSQPRVQKAIVSFKRLNDIIYAKEDILDTELCKTKITGKIEFCNVSFEYKPDIPVFSDVSFTVNSGDRVAIKGNNGTGKTTLAKMILNVYSPNKGKIHIDGVDIRKIPFKDLANNIVYIPQETFIFSDTIEKNLSLGDENIVDDKINEVLQLVDLSDFVDSLPEKKLTYVYENGKNLSGGQRQRIAIARALLREPKVIILDEATSQIDEKSDVEILQKIFQRYKDITFIIISHKKRIIDQCNKIVSLD